MSRHYLYVFFLCAAYSPSFDAVQIQTTSSDGSDGARKLAWFHVPKAGTSFGATVMRYANSSLPAEAPALLSAWAPFWAKYPVEKWFKDGMWKPECDHSPVSEEVYKSYKGHIVGMFREPKNRLVSAYFHKGYGQGDLLEYAHRAAGSMAMQLTGQDDGEHWLYWPCSVWKWCKYCGGGVGGDDGKPTPDFNLAVTRLHEGFMFVGLTEEYDFSVCLFHTMFGGDCTPEEFRNMRPGTHSHPEEVQGAIEKLKGYHDPVDDKLYETARHIFWGNMRQYHVSRSSCLQTCPQAGHIFGSTLDAKSENEVDYKYNWPGRYYLHDPDDE